MCWPVAALSQGSSVGKALSGSMSGSADDIGKAIGRSLDDINVGRAVGNAANVPGAAPRFKTAPGGLGNPGRLAAPARNPASAPNFNASPNRVPSNRQYDVVPNRVDPAGNYGVVPQSRVVGGRQYDIVPNRPAPDGVYGSLPTNRRPASGDYAAINPYGPLPPARSGGYDVLPPPARSGSSTYDRFPPPQGRGAYDLAPPPASAQSPSFFKRHKKAIVGSGAVVGTGVAGTGAYLLHSELNAGPDPEGSAAQTGAATGNNDEQTINNWFKP
jgi:hypothetical protein